MKIHGVRFRSIHFIFIIILSFLIFSGSWGIVSAADTSTSIAVSCEQLLDWSKNGPPVGSQPKEYYLEWWKGCLKTRCELPNRSGECGKDNYSEKVDLSCMNYCTQESTGQGGVISCCANVELDNRCRSRIDGKCSNPPIDPNPGKPPTDIPMYVPKTSQPSVQKLSDAMNNPGGMQKLPSGAASTPLGEMANMFKNKTPGAQQKSFEETCGTCVMTKMFTGKLEKFSAPLGPDVPLPSRNPNRTPTTNPPTPRTSYLVPLNATPLNPGEPARYYNQQPGQDSVVPSLPNLPPNYGSPPRYGNELGSYVYPAPYGGYSSDGVYPRIDPSGAAPVISPSYENWGSPSGGSSGYYPHRTPGWRQYVLPSLQRVIDDFFAWLYY